MRIRWFLFWLCSLPLLARIPVVVSIAPEADFVRQIAGDQAAVAVMVPPDSSPHSYEPKPSQMRTISDAALYFAIGVEFERAWLPRFLSQNPKLKVVDLSQAVHKIPMSPKHAHDGETHPGEDHEHEAHGHGLDPHIWLSVRNVEAMAPLIEKTLETADPAHAGEYRRNLLRFQKRLEALDAKLRSTLRPGTVLMVFHPSWGYFARDYGLVQLPVEVEGKEPTPRQLTRLIRTAHEKGVRVIVASPEFSDRSAQVLARELGIPVVKLSPLSTDWEGTLLRLAEILRKG